jgi:anthranilate/para-aminobenzoate synthase component II
MGATVGRAPELLHGKTSLVDHDGTGVLEGCRSRFTATRYHSLAIDPATLPVELVANGHTDSGLVMAVRHATCRCTACSSTPRACSPRAGTGSWPTGSPSAVTPRRSAAQWA